ncbi:hypothetical protein GL213_08750 [Halogeometricum borinquense]|uniref:DUF7961 domain-containing protein n=2 Tax=Halogeometricum borinquense TaxID=60847 RepID=E4NMC0_HALBP|nr:hypothetical protein [Halogeometricum borinquense]ADQ67325.1 hypothetical protein Hbor_17570 [Halogeometricum borinquense DSM 11551]ELY28540.1 hypothetical protein C499_07755 [Halogeometricum borinquense DSM 11551]QIB74192.1 hypothetical protein G3I44_07715 [Halogeometricum borinquense]QIQ76602.1 hypothetical protein GL213_08750 [Halogeometricum borinquense]RYJ13665.1 hypothetical protein ELS19_06615 [Halogeometricum borinquense]
MSTTPIQQSSAAEAIDADAVTDVTPISLSASNLDSTAPEYLRDLKSDLAADGYHPTVLTVEVCFGEDCPFATQTVADDLREFVRAASFLGAARLELTVTEVADEDTVETALRALDERAHREGVHFSVSGPISA